MDPSELAARAERLRALHDGDQPLVLPNAWDAASAKAVAHAGFPAVATTSGGVAAALGWADGEQTPPDEMFAAIARISRSVAVPVSADVEAGYGLSPDELAGALIAAGAAGCNVEDTDHRAGKALVPATQQAERIAALKAAGRAAGVDLVVNARVDVFVRDVIPIDERLEVALDRARHYRDAGADCVYPIGADEATLEAFAAACPGPVNGMVRAGAVRFSRLRAMGLARISFASALARLAMTDLAARLEAIGRSDDEWPQAPGR